MTSTDQEINELVAKKLGWIHCPGLEPLSWQRPDNGMLDALPDYCHSIEAAFEIAKTLSKIFTLQRLEDLKLWICRIGISPGQVESTAPRAICRAFLNE